VSNTFELTYLPANGGDVEMGESSSPKKSGYQINSGFLEDRKAQFKEVFPTLDVVGWYSVGSVPSTDDVQLHDQASQELHRGRVWLMIIKL
jgi:COP9 signalosome complex subunit 6